MFLNTVADHSGDFKESMKSAHAAPLAKFTPSKDRLK